MLLLVALALVAAPTAWAATPFRDLNSAGPLTDVWIGNDLSCQVSHTGDPTAEFFPSGTRGPADCGAFLSFASRVYGPDFVNHPGGSATPFSALSSYTPFTPSGAGQSAVTGSGTAGSPLTVTTPVSAGSSGLTVTEVDKYVVGNEYYRTSITVRNSGSVPASALLYHAGDCYLQGSDSGYGFVNPANNAPACSANANNAPPGLLEEFTPITGGSHYVETSFTTVWNDIAANGDFPNTCDCTTFQDNGAGINWDITIPARGSSTVSMLSNFSASGQVATSTPAPPQLSPSPPSVPGSSQAGFSGLVNPEGLPTTAHFEYGLDPKYSGGGRLVYDHSTPAQAVGNDFADHQVLASVAGLVPNAVYHVRLVASNAQGTVTGPDQLFTTTKAPAPPPPVLNMTANVVPVSGLVFVKPPPGKTLQGVLAAVAGVVKGNGFVPLTQARQLPLGSQIDSRAGTLDIVVASGRKSLTQKARLSGAVFTTSQVGGGIQKGLTTFALKDSAFFGAPSYKSCSARRASAGSYGGAHIAKLSPKVLQALHATDHRGHFRTRGTYSAATVRGTTWDTIDRCDGTLTIVRRGTVAVLDFGLRKTITLHAPHSYLAMAVRSKKKHK